VASLAENNPEVMNALATKLGLSSDVGFYDVWSLDEPELLAHIPRPVLALLVIIPWTEAWDRERKFEDAEKGGYGGAGPEEPVIWFKQTIGHACGSIGLLHCALNNTTAAETILSGSDLARIRDDAVPLPTAERAQMLYDSAAFEAAHAAVASLGQTGMPTVEEGHRLGQHFVAFVKARDGHLWELEGARSGPLDRGWLGADEDALSPKALDLGLRRIIRMIQAGDEKELRFSCLAMARKSG
jgi:ubiquitin carboxyl-terminal hydrolase L3